MIVIIPLAILLIGLVMFLVRKNRDQALESFSFQQFAEGKTEGSGSGLDSWKENVKGGINELNDWFETGGTDGGDDGGDL
ncbi:hypothetical protein [Aquibacillus kalidii]|uniref:hypothetical protein n=1 Tax=Aquibacillus kalidii TaxID=2762597 RepID=UPI0016448206|nr:hypothetical protein [Aquibacillus kalidii]